MAKNENVIINEQEIEKIINNLNNLEDSFDKDNDVLRVIESIGENKEEILNKIKESNKITGNKDFEKDFILEKINNYLETQNINKQKRININEEDNNYSDNEEDNNYSDNEEDNNYSDNEEDNNYDDNEEDNNYDDNYEEDNEEDLGNYVYSLNQFKFKDSVTDYNYINKKELEYQNKFGENFEVSFDGMILSLIEKKDINSNNELKSVNELKNILTKQEKNNIEKEFTNPKYKIFLNKELNNLNREELKELNDKLLESEIIITNISTQPPFFLEVSTKDINNIDLTKKELENKKELEKNIIIREIEKLKNDSQLSSSLLKNNVVKIMPNEKDLKNNDDEMKLSDFRLKTFSLFENLDENYVGTDIIDNLSFFVSSYGDIDLNKILNKINMPYYVEEAKRDLHLRGNEAPKDKNQKEITEFINNSSLNVTYRTEDNVKIIKRIKFLLNQEIEKIENKSENQKSPRDYAVINSHKKSLQDLNDSIQSFYVGRRTKEVANLLITSLKIEDDKNVIKNEIENNSFSFTNKEVIENNISINLKNIFNRVKKYKTNFEGEVSEVTKQNFNNIYEIMKNHHTSIPNKEEQRKLEERIFKNIYLYLNISYTDNDLNLNSLQNKVLKLAKTNLENENNSDARFKKLKEIFETQKFKEKKDVGLENNLISNTDDYETLITRLIQLSSDKEEKEKLSANLSEFKDKKNRILNTPNYNPKNLILLNKLNIENLKKESIFKRIEQLDKQKIEAYKSSNFIKASNMLIFQETVKNMHKILNENLLKEINLLTLGGTDNLKLKINEMVRSSFQADREKLLRKIVNELIASSKDVITQDMQINDLYSEYSKGGFKVTKGDSFLYQQIAIDILDNFEKNFSFISDSAVNIVEKAFDENSKFSKSGFDNLNKTERNKVYEESDFKEKINQVISSLNINTTNLEINNFNQALKLPEGESFEIILAEKVRKFFSSISEKDNDITMSSIKNVIIKELSSMENNLMSNDEINKKERDLIKLLKIQKELEEKLLKEIEKLEEIKLKVPDDLVNLNNLRIKNMELIKVQDKKNELLGNISENSKINDVKNLFKILNSDGLNINKNENEKLNRENKSIENIFDLALNNVIYIDKNQNNINEIGVLLKDILNNQESIVGEVRKETDVLINLLMENSKDIEKSRKLILDYQKTLLELKDKNDNQIEKLSDKIELKEKFINSLTEKTEVMLNKFKINQIINEDNISNILFSNNEVKKNIQENLGLTPETVKIIYDGFKNNLFDNDGNNLMQDEIKNKLYFKDLVQEYKKERKENIKQKISGLEEKIAEIKEENRRKIGNLSHIIIKNEINNNKTLLHKMFSSFKSKYLEDGVTEEELTYKFITFLESKDMLKHNKFIKLEKIHLFKSNEQNLNEICNNFLITTIENGDFKNLNKNLENFLKDNNIVDTQKKNSIIKKITNLINNGVVADKNRVSYTIDDSELLKGVNGKESNLLNDFKEVLKREKNSLRIEDIDFIIANYSFFEKMNINELSNKNYNNFNDLSLHLTQSIENLKNDKELKTSKTENLSTMSQLFKDLKVSKTLNLYKDVVSSTTNYNYLLSSDNQKNLKEIFECKKDDNIINFLNSKFNDNKSEDLEMMNRINHIFECTENKEYKSYSEKNTKNKELFIENMVKYINNNNGDYKESFLKNLQKMDGESTKQLSSIFSNFSSVESIVSFLSTDKPKLKNFLDNYISDYNILNNLSSDVLTEVTPSLIKKSIKNKKNKVDLTISNINNNKNIEKDRRKIEKYVETYVNNILSKIKKDKTEYEISPEDKKDLINFIYNNNNDFSLFKNLILKNKDNKEEKILITLQTQDMMDDFVQSPLNKTFETTGNSINKRNNLKEIEVEVNKLQEKYNISPKFKLKELFNEDNEFDFNNKNNFILLKKMLSLETNGLNSGKIKISGEEFTKIENIDELDNLIKLKLGDKNSEGISINILKEEFTKILSDKNNKEDFTTIVENVRKESVPDDKYIINILSTNKKDKNLNISVNENNEISFINNEGIPLLDGVVPENLVNNDLVNVTKAVLYNSKSVEMFAKDKIPKNMEQLDTVMEESKNIFTIDKKYGTVEKHTFDKIGSQKDKLEKQIENLENLEKTMFEEEKIRLFLYNEKDGTKEIGEDGEHKYVDYKISSLFSGETNDILNNMSRYSSLKGIDSIDTIVEEQLEQDGYTFEKGSEEYTKQYMRLYELELNKVDTTRLFNKRKLFPEEVFENQLKIKIEHKGQTKEYDLQEVLKGYKKKYINLKTEIMEKKSKLRIFNKVEEQFQNPKEELKKAFGELKPHWGESQPKKNMFKRLLMNMNEFLPDDLKEEILIDFENSYTPEKEKEFLSKYGKKLNIGSTSPTFDDLFNAILDQKLELFGKDDLESSKCLNKLDDLMKEFGNHSKNNKKTVEIQEKVKAKVKSGKEYTWRESKSFGDNVFKDAGRALLMGF